jgi:hypothetical protein
MTVNGRRELLVVIAFVILIRLPFLNQPIQGDDVYYLAIARNVAMDPLHPMKMGYMFQGAKVSMAGHPHPPLNAYVLAVLLHIFGGVRPRPFHAAYILFSVVAAIAAYSLARRFTERPLLATMLFISVPAFVVNGNSLEADLPFLALWMAGMALYFSGRHRLAAGSLALAGLAAYQAVFAAPILAHHVWYGRRRSRSAWLTVIAAPATLAAWQLFQRISTGELPAGVLGGYFKTYGLVALERKAHSAMALLGHLGWIVFPAAAPWSPAAAVGALLAFLPSGYALWQRLLLAVSLAAGVALLACWAAVAWKKRRRDEGFLASWGLVFFGGAVLVFFAGSARYLLPMAAAVVFRVARSARRPALLWFAAAANLTLGLTLAAANYHHWRAYREFAARLRPVIAGRQTWTNAEWGLRYYLEQAGAEAIERDQPVYPGSVVITSELAGRIPFIPAGRVKQVASEEIWSSPPVLLIGLGTRSGYSSSDVGVLPFDLGRGLVDRAKVELVAQSEPRLSYLRMNDPAASEQLLSGFYQVENNAWRWMAPEAVAVLKVPERVTRFELMLTIPDAAPARRIRVAINGIMAANQTYLAPAGYTLTAPVSNLAAGTAPLVTISVDKGFQAPPDDRKLGVIVQELGFR